MADIEETFTQYPLTITVETHMHQDLKTKKKTPVQVPTVVLPSSTSSSSSKAALRNELEALNALHRDLVLSDPENPSPTFPPSLPMDPKRSALLENWLEIGSVEQHKKGNPAGAINAYKLGLKLEFDRPAWDWHDRVRDECSVLAFRLADAHAALREWRVAKTWAETALDIETGTEMKILSQKPSNPFEAEQMRAAVERVRGKKESLFGLYSRIMEKLEEEGKEGEGDA
ncbi:hypothetical protein F5Y17DRAFT_338029 [Xylariaceae sp. FL0594]|nr:hypothetical protein F5Y17DRAFT_338029 [Xylariaceae sp. FL0594]